MVLFPSLQQAFVQKGRWGSIWAGFSGGCFPARLLHLAKQGFQDSSWTFCVSTWGWEVPLIPAEKAFLKGPPLLVLDLPRLRASQPQEAVCFSAGACALTRCVLSVGPGTSALTCILSSFLFVLRVRGVSFFPALRLSSNG